MADLDKTIVQAQACIDRYIERSWDDLLCGEGSLIAVCLREPFDLERIRNMPDDVLCKVINLALLGHTVVCHQKMQERP